MLLYLLIVKFYNIFVLFVHRLQFDFHCWLFVAQILVCRLCVFCGVVACYLRTLVLRTSFIKIFMYHSVVLEVSGFV